MRLYILLLVVGATTIVADEDDKKTANGSAVDMTLEDFFNNAVTSGGTGEKKECGWDNPDIKNYTTPSTGQTSPIASYGDFPWMVALMRKTDDSGVWAQSDYLGGATLIHPSAVITVAHKFTVKKKKLQPNELKCRAGEYDTQSTLEPHAAQERDVAKYFIHEEYYRTSLYNNIALVILATPFDLSVPHIATGCLAKDVPADKYNCFSMGWGLDNFNNKKKNAVILKKEALKFVEHNRCEDMLIKRTRLGVSGTGIFKLHESIVCADGEKGTCRGDGGSPLVCPVTNKDGKTRYAVYGLVASGLSCGNPLIPGMYTNVPKLRGWIDKKMKQEGLDDAYYTL
ncbi:phenoloxidase-activating factor 2-like [Epargyreus clarus]|uniref:phenoloxidase-activating factor 2-like n=1 Tax=Epargyreus clarus TaxID=520877 RepID=UPI003C2E9FE1